MNAAGRLVNQNLLTRQFSALYFLVKRQMVIMLLGLTVLMSAISVIYVAHHTRVLHAAIQHHLTVRENLQLQRGQLLLERGTWMMQARIQQYAEKKLDMIVPSHQSIVVVRE